MLHFELPTDRVDYLQLAFPAAGSGLVARWGTQITPFTVAVWEMPGTPPAWQLTDRPLNLSPDGEWVSVYDRGAGEVRVTRVGAKKPTAVVERDKKADNVWTAVAPGGAAVAWKDGGFAVVRALPGGEPVARVKSGFGYDLRFSPGGRWLTEHGDRVFRVFDRTNNYRVFARIRTPSFILAEVTDGLTAVVNAANSTVAVWDLSGKSATAVLPVGGSESALAISTDGRRVLTGNLDGEVTLWDATGTQLQRYDWGVETPIAAAFARDGTRAAIGGTDGRIVVWDLDE
jgi:WD40 repeat protein